MRVELVKEMVPGQEVTHLVLQVEYIYYVIELQSVMPSIIVAFEKCPFPSSNQVAHVPLLLLMATLVLVQYIILTIPTTGEIIYITIATVVILCTEVALVEPVSVMVRGLPVLQSV